MSYCIVPSILPFCAPGGRASQFFYYVPVVFLPVRDKASGTILAPVFQVHILTAAAIPSVKRAETKQAVKAVRVHCPDIVAGEKLTIFVADKRKPLALPFEMTIQNRSLQKSTITNSSGAVPGCLPQSRNYPILFCNVYLYAGQGKNL
jgi:hypothetical protein